MNIHRNSVYLLVVAVIGLIVLGLVMLSSTAGYARESGGNASILVQKQAAWLVVGAAACMFAAMLDYHRWAQTWWVWFALSVVLLVLCFIPPIAHPMNGSARWLRVAGFSFQPSELAKLSTVIALAWWFSRAKGTVRNRVALAETPQNDEPEVRVERTFVKGFVLPLAGVGVLMALIAREVDLGATALLGATTLILMFVAGTCWRYLAPTVLLGVAGLVLAVKFMPERMGRILAFLHPELYPDDAYQQLMGLIALGSGGVEGFGLGLGRQKIEYLPFAHTDFIFPVIGEELGLRFTLGVVFAFVVIILSGSVIAIRARDRFGMLLGFGVVTLIALQAAVNIGVTTMMLPNKGMPLPFISYGGSNLVFCLACIGILINIWRRGVSDKEEKSNVRLAVRTRKKPVRI